MTQPPKDPAVQGDDWLEEILNDPNYFLLTEGGNTVFNPAEAKAAIQAQVDEAVRGARIDENERYIQKSNAHEKRMIGKQHSDNGVSTQDFHDRIEQLTTQYKSKEAEKHDATQRPNTLDT